MASPILRRGMDVMERLFEKYGCYMGVVYHRHDESMNASQPGRTPEIVKERNNVYFPDDYGFVLDMRWTREQLIYQLIKWMETLPSMKEDPGKKIPLALYAALQAIHEKVQDVTEPIIRTMVAELIKKHPPGKMADSEG